MKIRVQLHGVLGGPASGSRGRVFDLALGEKATAGDILKALAARWGAPFPEFLESSDQRLPRQIRMFADGEPLTTREQRLVSAGASSKGVTVVLLTPMMGG
jgi:hypothetical protein